MPRRKLVSLSVLILCAVLLAYLFFPLRSRRNTVRADRRLLEGKEAYLQERRRQIRSQRRPNIILIVADDLGKTDISLFGNDKIQTPKIDAIGHAGVIFDNAYCTSPICSPSRAGYLTGRYQQRFGYELQSQSRYPRNRLEYLIANHLVDMGEWSLNGNRSFPSRQDQARQGIPRSEINLGEMLQANGYATAIFGKWHLGLAESYLPHNRGFDLHYGFYEAFSLYAPLDDPGIISHKHEYYLDRYQWKKGRKGTSAILRNGVVVEEGRYLTTAIAEEAVRFIHERHDDGQPFFLYVPFNAPHTPFQATREHFDRLAHISDTNSRIYYAMIAALDDAVGTITTALKDLDMAGETLIVFTSDNGGATYTGATDNHPLEGGKMTNFEGGLNVPLLISWPARIPPGTRYQAAVSLADIFPTCAAAAAADLPADRVYDGVDLLPYATGIRDGPPHRALFWRSDYTNIVITAGWKLIRDEKRDRSTLFDLRNDKLETTDLSGVFPDKVEELRRLFGEWNRGLVPPRWRSFIEFRHRAADGTFHYFPI